MTSKHYRDDNTEGYTQAELDALNAELNARLVGIEPGSDEWHETVQRHADEVARRTPQTARTAAARALRAIPSETRSETSRANGRRGGRPVILGTIATDAGRATVRYAPGAGRVEVVLPAGTVEVPEEAAVESLEEARETAEAWYGRDRRVWDWQPR